MTNVRWLQNDEYLDRILEEMMRDEPGLRELEYAAMRSRLRSFSRVGVFNEPAGELIGVYLFDGAKDCHIHIFAAHRKAWALRSTSRQFLDLAFERYELVQTSIPDMYPESQRLAVFMGMQPVAYPPGAIGYAISKETWRGICRREVGRKRMPAAGKGA